MRQHLLNLVPGRPPLNRGSSGTPRSPIADDEFDPKGSCSAVDLARAHEKRNSFTVLALRTLVQPSTSPLDVMFWRPPDEELVPSAMPPKSPGMKRNRVV